MNANEQSVTIPKGDLLLQEMWRIKDERSASRGHSVERLFEGLREREAKSGRLVVNLQRETRNPSNI